jgi:hypothetical protein
MTSIAKDLFAEHRPPKRTHPLSELSAIQTNLAGVHSARAEERIQYSINDKPTHGGHKHETFVTQ